MPRIQCDDSTSRACQNSLFSFLKVHSIIFQLQYVDKLRKVLSEVIGELERIRSGLQHAADRRTLPLFK